MTQQVMGNTYGESSNISLYLLVYQDEVMGDSPNNWLSSTSCVLWFHCFLQYILIFNAWNFEGHIQILSNTKHTLFPDKQFFSKKNLSRT